MTLRAERITATPIVRPHMDDRMGDNIGTPSVIRVPEWLPNPLGRYYLYFSHHKGHFIRMAFADALTGPWTVHRPGVLDITESLFPPEDPPELPVAQRPVWAKHMKGGYLYAHIASPDVHVRDADRCLYMYFHGLMPNGDQLTRLAVSSDGLTFQVLPLFLARPISASANMRAGCTQRLGVGFC